MAFDEKIALEQIRSLFESEALGVLSTEKDGQPYASLVAFTALPELDSILFLTPRSTRKYDNLSANPRVALLVNNSRNRAEDFYAATAVTALGAAAPVSRSGREDRLAHHLQQHPHLAEFAAAPTTELVKISVTNYVMVNRFQNVTDIRITP